MLTDLRRDLRNIEYPFLWGIASTLEKGFENDGLLGNNSPLLFLLQEMDFVEVTDIPVCPTLYGLNDRAREAYDSLVEEGFYEPNITMDSECLDTINMDDNLPHSMKFLGLKRVISLGKIVLLHHNKGLTVGQMQLRGDDYWVTGVLLQRDDVGKQKIDGQSYSAVGGVSSQLHIPYLSYLGAEPFQAYFGKDQDRMRHRIHDLSKVYKG